MPQPVTESRITSTVGTLDDAYGIGETDGGINLAKALIESLDNDAPLPDLPALDYEDEDEDEDEE